MIISSGEDRTVRLWDARTGFSAIVMENSGRVGRSLLSPDRRRLLTLPHGNWHPHRDLASVATLWDAATGQRISELVDQINDAAFSPDGTTILTGGEDRTARLRSAKDGRFLGMLKRHAGPIIGVAFRPDSKLAATLAVETSAPIGFRYRLRWWDVQRLLEIAPTCESDAPAYLAAGSANIHFLARDIVVFPGEDQGMRSIF